MHETRIVMGMPITLVSVKSNSTITKLFQRVYDFFTYVDDKYSPYRTTSDISKINRLELNVDSYDDELQAIEKLAERTRLDTLGYFNIWHKGNYDPSGIVKAWAIDKVVQILAKSMDDFYIDAGGDIQTYGTNGDGRPWRIGIRNPFNRDENVGIVHLQGEAVATSGTAIRGQHIYNPLSIEPIKSIVSISVVASNIIDADRMATAAFAMGRDGINFIERLDGYEGYLIDDLGIATQTTGWHKY